MEYLINKSILILFFLSTSLCSAQEVLLEEEPTAPDTISTMGPNSKNYFHVFVQINPFIPNNNNIKSIFFKSNEISFGCRYKRKITNTFSIGSDGSFTQSLFKLKQSTNKAFPTTEIFDSEKIVITSLGVAPYLRVNLGKRGEFLGKFIDASFYFNYFIASRHETKIKIYNTDYQSQKEIKKYKDLKYLPDYEYGFLIRAGYNRISLFYKQRLTQLIDDDTFPNIGDLPNQSAGIELKL